MSGVDEHALLERVFLRIGSAETDDQLENAVGKFLPPVLLKLCSSQEGVRKKVMELLVHVNKRLKSRPQVQLPIEALLIQYQDPSATSFVVNFTIIYLKMGYPRLSIEKQVDLLPTLLCCFKGKPQQHQDSLLSIVIAVLPHVKIPPDAEKCKTILGLHEKHVEAKLLREFAMDFLLLPYGVVQPSDGSGIAPPGMSESALKRVLGEQPLNSESIEQFKLGIVKFFNCGICPELDVVPMLIVASSDTRHSVASAADLELRRISGSIDWNNANLVNSLFTLFLGTLKEQKSIRPEHKRTAANTRIRLKLFPYLLKSREAVQVFPAVIQVVFEALYGQQTNAKLKNMALQFFHNMCNFCPESKLLPVQGILLSGMLKLINDPQEDVGLKNLAYVAVGKLGNKLPGLVTKNISVVSLLFDALAKEGKESRVALQEALSVLATSFKQQDASVQPLMEALLQNHIESPEPQLRQMALHYAFVVFPTDHIPSRYMLMLAAGDVKEDIRAEATKALKKLKADRNDENIALPSFENLMAYVVEKASARLKTNRTHSVGSVVLPFNVQTYVAMLQFSRSCLAARAGISTKDLEDGPTPDQCPRIASFIRQSLLEGDGKLAVDNYLKLSVQFLSAVKDSSVVYNLLEMVAMSPDILAQRYQQQLPIFKGLMSSPKEDMRENAAHLVALLVAYTFTDQEFVDFTKEMIEQTESKVLDTVHGSLIALGYSIGYRLRQNLDDLSSPFFGNVVSGAVKNMVSHLSRELPLVASGACLGLGEAVRISPVLREFNVIEILETLGQILTCSKTTVKGRERAAFAIGYIAVGDAKFIHCKESLETLLLTAFEAVDVDSLFSIGEAMCCSILGPSSPAARNIWTQTLTDYKTADDYIHKNELEWLLEELTKKYVIHTKPSVRQAGCVWVLSLLKSCGHIEVIQLRLQQLQNSLLNLLADPSEITQDVAAKGLCLLYDLGSEHEKKQLLSLLVEALTSGRKSEITVTKDTKLFEEGTLGKSPIGGNLTTYQELCSLASDLNQPDLMYKFMHLANHQAMWNSKKGAAFGFGEIALQAEQQLSEYLPKVVPKLYRYQFDPSSNTRQSFTSIWHAMVSDTQKTIDKYLKEILQDLLNNLTNSQWRVRESSCLAVADVLRGRQLSDVLDFLPLLWETLFKVRDDIKETVRNAAESALSTLSKVSIRLCDSNNSSSSKEALTYLLPTLVKFGITSSVSEVRAVSLFTISQISKSAGVMLKPHLPLLIVALLEALSELEPRALNYLSVRLESDSKELLDSARIAHSKTSPAMDTLNRCIQYVDEATLVELVPRIIDMIRNSVGLATKAGCAHLVTTLVLHHATTLQPHTGKLMAAFVQHLQDRNGAIRRSYAQALGHLVKIAKESSVAKLVQKLQSLYMEKNDETVPVSCAATIQAIARHSPDALMAHATDILPFVFFAQHATPSEDKSNVTPWEEVWTEFTAGTESGIQLYLGEISSWIDSGFQSQSWVLKVQAAATLKTVTTKLKATLPADNAVTLLNLLLSNIAGRTWDGKESILRSLSALCVNSKSSLQSQVDENGHLISDGVITQLLKECKKEKLEYKQEAVQCLAAILDAYRADHFAELYLILEPHVLSQSSKEADNGEEKAAGRQMMETALESLGKSWPSTESTQREYLVPFSELLLKSMKTSTWKVLPMILKTTTQFVQRLDAKLVDSDDFHSVANNILVAAGNCLAMQKYSAVRLESLILIETIQTRFQGIKMKGSLPPYLEEQLQQVQENDSNLQLQDRARKLLNLLNTLEFR